MKKFLFLLFFPSMMLGQGVFTISTDGTTDTAAACSGVLVDGGGVNGNYNNYDNGYFIIDPPGNAPVSINFTSFSTFSSSDRIYLYDGAGTSGTYLGSYYGSSLPNSGSSITSTSGAITLRFYANYSGTASGFQFSWTTGGTTAPSASFTSTSTSISFNTPIQFVNTSTNSGSSYWDFGDGNTSTSTNPTHLYTSSGSKTIMMVSTNCFSSDTAYSTITVGSAPQATASNDSILLTIPCGTTASQTWTLSNAAGSGNLTLSTDLVDTNYVFNANFEDGSLETFTALSSSGTVSNSSTYAYTGSKSLSLNGYFSSATPFTASFNSSQPTSVSYASKMSASTSTSGYTWFGSSVYPSLGYSPFGYTYWSYGSKRIVYRTATGSTTTYYHYPTNLDWAHLEYANIDWSNKTFDIIINGSTVVTGASFYYSSATDVKAFSGYQFNSGANYFLDDIKVKGGAAIDITYSPAIATVAPGNNVVLTFTVDATNLLNGTYYLSLNLTSNDTTLNGTTIPVIVEVTGSGQWTTASTSCESYSSYTGTIISDTLDIWNTGCDTLVVNSLSTSSSRLQSLVSSFVIAPDDSVRVPISYNANTSGTYLDTLYFNENDSLYTQCFTAVISDAPSINTDSTTFNISIIGCPDSVNVPFWIYNDGMQVLNWGTYSTGVSLMDNFETGLLNTSIWSYTGSSATIGSSCGTINGSYSLQFYGSGVRAITSNQMNLSSGGDIKFNLSQGSCETADAGEGVYVQYSTNGITWVDIQYFYTTSTFFCSTTIPTAAMTTATQIRLVQKAFSGGTYDNMVVDDFEIDAGYGQNLTFNPDTGNVSIADSQLVNIVLNTDTLQDGLHTFEGFISSNDPVDSILWLTVNLTLDGVSETFVNRTNCKNLDTLVKGASYVDSVFVENLGCDSLYFGSITTSDVSFAASASPGQMWVGDSGWVVVSITPTAVGMIQDTVYIGTSDTIWPICYSGYVDEAPNAWVSSSAINIATVNCGDSVGFSFDLGNTASNTTLDWTISSGEVLNVLVVTSNTFPSLLTNFQNYLSTVDDLSIKTVSSTSTVPSELGWADVVIFPSITASALSSDYTAIEDDMETFIDGGGKMVIMGSTFVNDILAMDFITGYYYGNYTNYTHYVNTTLNHPYLQGVNGFIPQSAALNSYIYNSGIQNLVYYAYYSQALSYVPIGDGELIYYGFNFNSVYSDITTIMDNILSSTLANKGIGVNWLSFSPSQGSTTGGDTSTVNVMAYSDSLEVGIYNLNISVSSNDPTGGAFIIPVTFTVNGKGESAVDAGCENFGNVYQNMTHTQDVNVYNVGCDTLIITGTSTAGTSFTSSTSSIVIAPGDTGFVPVDLYHSTIGVVSDTLMIYTDADTTLKCLTATIVGASDISVTPNPINVTINKCNSFATVPYSITNNGSASLSYDVSVAEVYDSLSTQTWLYAAPNYSNQQTHRFNNIIDSDTLFYDIILNGAYSTSSNFFYLYLNNSYVQTFYDNNTSDYTNDTVTGFITGTQLSNAITAGYFDVRIYSYNYSSTANQTCAVHVYQRNEVTWAAPVGLTTGTVTAANSVSKSLIVTVTSLAVGSYNTTVIFETNDPSDPVYTVPMSVTVVSQPDMVLNSNTLSFGTLYNTNPIIDSVQVENNGCTDLSISNIVSNNSHFTPSWTNKIIAAGTSDWLPVTFTATTSGLETGVLTITNNDSLQIISVQANVIFAPVADYQFSVQNSCTGLVSFSNESTNGSQYFWAFGDGTFSAAVNPSHSYSKPGSYSVMLVTINSGGSDTLFKSVSLNDILYVSSEFPDTVQAGQVIQFIDSSMFPSSWQWYFGDGNNATSPNPQHTYANKGTFIVTLLASNSAGCSGSDNKQIVVTSGIGVSELIPKDLLVFPNPTRGVVKVSTASRIEFIELYSITGQFITRVQESDRIDLQHLPAGSYLLVINGGHWVAQKTIEVLK